MDWTIWHILHTPPPSNLPIGFLHMGWHCPLLVSMAGTSDYYLILYTSSSQSQLYLHFKFKQKWPSKLMKKSFDSLFPLNETTKCIFIMKALGSCLCLLRWCFGLSLILYKKTNKTFQLGSLFGTIFPPPVS